MHLNVTYVLNHQCLILLYVQPKALLGWLVILHRVMRVAVSKIDSETHIPDGFFLEEVSLELSIECFLYPCRHLQIYVRKFQVLLFISKE